MMFAKLILTRRRITEQPIGCRRSRVLKFDIEEAGTAGSGAKYQEYC